MSWERLRSIDFGERDDLQPVFNDWGGARDRCSVVGLPRWFDELGTPEVPSARTSSYGYSFTPDALWRDDYVVAELKAGPKYEPIALAEVLHHAHYWSEQSGKDFAAVLITQENAWLRRSIDWLQKHGALRALVPQPKCPLLTHFEFAAFIRPKRRGKLDERRFLWFEEPLAKWERVDAPRMPPLRSTGTESVTWHRVIHSDGSKGNWIATSAPPDSTNRPLFLSGNVAMLAAVGAEEIERANEILLWHGVAPDADKGKTRWSVERYIGASWLWTASCESETQPPSLFFEDD